MEAHAASAKVLPPLDEATFQQLLEAAYVIQEQRELQSMPPDETPAPPLPITLSENQPSASESLSAAEILALIVETQEQLRSQVRDLPTAGRLIAQRLEQVTNAAGVAIAIIREDHLEFCAATGVLSSLAGSTAPVGSSLPELLHANSWSSVELSIRHDAKCPIVFPIFHEGRTTGLLHLSFPGTDQLEEHQIRTCQVMAGLMGEAINRVSELEWKKTLAAERTTMMQILERLRPQLERLASESNSASQEDLPVFSPSEIPATAAEKPEPAKLTILPVADEPKSFGGAVPACQQCGFKMKEDEVFCGQCGAPQLDLTLPLTLPDEEAASQWSPQSPKINPPVAPETAKVTEPSPAANVQSEQEVALPPSLEQALAHLPKRDVVERFRPRLHPMIEDALAADAEIPANGFLRNAALRDGTIQVEIPDRSAPAPLVSEPAELELPPSTIIDPSSEPTPTSTPESAEEKPVVAADVSQPQVPKPSPWASATQAHQWLQSLQSAQSPSRIWLNKHRADLWVVVSLILLLLALSGWGSRTAIYGAAQTKVVQPSLTLFERLLVALDLAEPPPAPVNLGNPNARVWVDLHTALYYCPGADLYGKTPEGKFTSQRDAQLDQFQPAARAYCQ